MTLGTENQSAGQGHRRLLESGTASERPRRSQSDDGTSGGRARGEG